MQDSIFTRIIKGEINSYKVLEEDKFIAFLDVNPIKEGHTLVVPKMQVDYIYDLPEDIFKELFVFSKKVSRILKKTFDCKRIGLSVIGLEVPHAHIHLVPIDHIKDMSFESERIQYSNEEFSVILKRIKESNL